MKIKEILGIIIGFLGILTIISMWAAMSSGDVERGAEIFANSMIPWWLNPLVVLSSSSIGVIIVVLIILFNKQILNFNIR